MRKNGQLTYLHGDHLGSTVRTTGASDTWQRYFAYGRTRWGGGLPTDRTFTGQVQDGSGLVYMNARYYDPATGQFVSPDMLVPDAGNLFDYNRYMYARGNPLKYNDPSGHCSTAAPDPDVDGAVEEYVACWQKAGTIMAMYDGDAWWQETFGVGKEAWFKNIAMNPSTDSAWMQGRMDDWYRAFTLRTGLAHPERRYEPHPAPKHPMEAMCETWDCTSVGLDAASLFLSAAADGIGILCVVATDGACGVAFAAVKVMDVGVSLGSVTYTSLQWMSGKASDLDLAVGVADFVISVTPIGGEISGWVTLTYDLADPFVNEDVLGTTGRAK